MSTPSVNTLDYATPARHHRPIRQRILYCLSLPLIAFGMGISQGQASPSDRLLGALIMTAGALLLAFALPLRSERG